MFEIAKKELQEDLFDQKNFSCLENLMKTLPHFYYQFMNFLLEAHLDKLSLIQEFI